MPDLNFSSDGFQLELERLIFLFVADFMIIQSEMHRTGSYSYFKQHASAGGSCSHAQGLAFLIWYTGRVGRGEGVTS